MRDFEGLRRVFRVGIGGGDAERDVERELAHHFESTLEELRASGLTETEARAEARRRFGEKRRYVRELRRMARGRERRGRLWGRLRTVGDVGGEVVRGALRSPGPAVAVIVVMALGLGANAVVFEMLDRVFLRAPAHVAEADGLRRVFVAREIRGETATLKHHAYPDFGDWRGLDVFGGLAAVSRQEKVVGRGDRAARRPVALVTASYFPLLGVRPELGRLLVPADDRFGAPLAAVLSYEYWRGELGGDPAVLGRAVAVGEAEYTVVGVAPPGFTGVDLDPVDLWLPFHPAGEIEEGGREWVESRGWHWFEVVARLADGTPAARAAAAATAAHRMGRSAQDDYDPRARVELEPLQMARTTLASREALLLPWLMGVAGMVLLLTAANVANLLLARGMRRRREMAVRLALGVSRRRLVGTAVAETLLLAAAGGVAALVLALWGGDLVRAVLLPDIAWRDAGAVPMRLIVFTGVVALSAGLVAAIPPAIRSGRSGVTDALKGAGRGVAAARSRTRTGLLILQSAISVVLLLGTGLFVLSVREARDLDLGFEPDRVLLVRLTPEGGYPGGAEMTRLYREARERLAGIPGVESRAISTVTPMRNGRGVDLRVPGRDSLPPSPGPLFIDAVTSEYFETMGIDVLSGRGIRAADDAATAPRVAVVNEAMARAFWPEEPALGHCLIIQEQPCATIVGVVENTRVWELVEEPMQKYYVPLAQAPFPWPPSRLMLATRDPQALAGPVQRTLRAAMPDIRLVTTEPMGAVVSPKYRAWTLGAALFTALGILALLVTAVGLYGVLAFDVALRRSEMGVRAALGAGRSRLTRLVLRDGMKVAAIGVGAGILVAAAARPWVEPLLFEVSPLEPAVVGGVAIVITAVAAAASGIPAWRASRVPPAEALQVD